MFEPRCSIFEDPVESKCAGFTNLKDEHEALPGYSGSLSPCAGSSMSAKNEANDSINMPAEYLPQLVGSGNSKPITTSLSPLLLQSIALPYYTAISSSKYRYLLTVMVLSFCHYTLQSTIELKHIFQLHISLVLLVDTSLLCPNMFGMLSC